MHENALPLLRQLPGVDAVIAQEAGNDIPHVDYWAMLLDLPLHFCETPAPYFHASEDAIQRWPLPAGQLHVDVVWKGSTAHDKDRFHSLPGLETLRTLFSVPGIAWRSLQKSAGEEEALNSPPGISLLALGHQVQDYADTAAIVAQLDLLISVDTSVAPLTGRWVSPVGR